MNVHVAVLGANLTKNDREIEGKMFEDVAMWRGNMKLNLTMNSHSLARFITVH